jgi:hypothetical protein
MSKAAREAEIDASLAQPLTARWSTNWPASSWSENCSERDVLRAITPGMDSGEPGRNRQLRRQHYEMKRSAIAHPLWSGRGDFLPFCCSSEWCVSAAFAIVSAIYRRFPELPGTLPSPEDVIHDLGACGDHGPQFPAVDDLGCAGGGVPD